MRSPSSPPHHEDAARKRLKSAVRRLGSHHDRLRAASLALVAEVADPDRDPIGDIDRPLATAMNADPARIRTAAAIAAGNLLSALGTVSDADLGLRDGTVAEAENALLRELAGYR